jgi:hypothetical protein
LTSSLPRDARPIASLPTLSRPIAKPPIAAAPTASAPIAAAPVAVAGRAPGRKDAIADRFSIRANRSVVSLGSVNEGPPILLAVQHVSYESPHRILDACGRLGVRAVQPTAGDALPDHSEVSGAVVMGGPMNVDEVEDHPALAEERKWLAEAPS